MQEKSKLEIKAKLLNLVKAKHITIRRSKQIPNLLSKQTIFDPSNQHVTAQGAKN